MQMDSARTEFPMQFPVDTDGTSGSRRVGVSIGTFERARYRFIDSGTNSHSGGRQQPMPQVAGETASTFSGDPGEDAGPAPLPFGKRPVSHSRGWILIPTLLLLSMAGSGLAIWDQIFRYQAYGIVTGRMIEVAAPLGGILQSVYVRDGESARQDQSLATIRSLECEHQLARIEDELRIAQASLLAEVTRLQLAEGRRTCEILQANADFHRASGDAHQDEGQLQILQDQLGRLQGLKKSSALGDADLQSTTIQQSSQANRLIETRQAVDILKTRAAMIQGFPDQQNDLIAPLTARTELLLNEAARLRERMEQGHLKMPVNGTILRRHHPAGECAREHEPLFTVVEESSTEIILYIPQSHVHEYAVGNILKLRIDPSEEPIPGTVSSIGQEHCQPPEQLEAYYRPKVKLVPVRIRPLDADSAGRHLRIGAVARLPAFGARG